VLDFTREQFEKELFCLQRRAKEEGTASSQPLPPAHLYIWDEPLNYIDLFPAYKLKICCWNIKPTMLFVEHDQVFCDKIATKSIILNKSI
jgi:lincosamide and streptogramin A transport system ATP-binding/permease protein